MADDRKIPFTARGVPSDVSRESAEHATEDKVTESGEKLDGIAHRMEDAAKESRAAVKTLDEVLEYAVSAAAEGLITNAKALEGVNANLKRMQTSNRYHLALLCMVALGVLVSVYALVGYTVPNSKVLVDCTTPSTPGHPHPCSDRSAQGGFNLSVAIVKCEKNLPAPVHTIDVKQCVASELGVALDAALPKR